MIFTKARGKIPVASPAVPWNDRQCQNKENHDILATYNKFQNLIDFHGNNSKTFSYYNQGKKKKEKGYGNDLMASLQKDSTIVQSNRRQGSETVCKKLKSDGYQGRLWYSSKQRYHIGKHTVCSHHPFSKDCYIAQVLCNQTDVHRGMKYTATHPQARNQLITETEFPSPFCGLFVF